MTCTPTLVPRAYQIGSFTLASMVALLAGCLSSIDPAALLPEEGLPTGRGSDTTPGDGSIADGTSNTILIGEEPDTQTPADPAPPTGAPPAPPVDNLAAQFQAALGDRFLEFGEASFFSSGSITANHELVLCAFGRFGMRITQVTSTDLGSTSSERSLTGTWSVQSQGQRLLLVLNVEEASDPDDVGTQAFELAADADNHLFVDGAAANVADATTDCRAAQQP